jgi:hypothetical protein
MFHLTFNYKSTSKRVFLIFESSDQFPHGIIEMVGIPSLPVNLGKDFFVTHLIPGVKDYKSFQGIAIGSSRPCIRYLILIPQSLYPLPSSLYFPKDERWLPSSLLNPGFD